MQQKDAGQDSGEIEKWEVSGRWQGSKALAAVVIAVNRDGNVTTSRAFGEKEERERGKNVSAADNVDGQAAKSSERLHVCLALPLLGGVDKTERRKERKQQQGN